MTQFTEQFDAAATNIERAIQGKPEAIRLALVCLFSEGHILLEDAPGLGKTTLAKAIAASIDGDWRRVQFTPDLLPSDITGVAIYNEATQEFEFHEGPAFTNVLVGDEINRASPKTQAALLEVMAENQITVEGSPRPVPRPFIVMATQNPIEYAGTYQLPEAQRDRFMMRLSLGYPDIGAEVAIIANESAGPSVDQLSPVMAVDHVQSMIEMAQRVEIATELEHYIARLAAESRQHPDLSLGASPRGSLALARAARTLAASEGRDYVVPGDLKRLAEPVLAHRLILTPESEVQGRSANAIVRAILEQVAVPQTAGDLPDLSGRPAGPSKQPAAPPAPAPAAAAASPPPPPPPGAGVPAPEPAAPADEADRLPEVTLGQHAAPAGKKSKQKP